MGSDTNYTLVGLFVVVFTAGALGFAYWLAKTGGQEDYAWYQVFMTESVAGLTTDSAVKYQGVDVGTVAKLGLNPDNPEQVRLLLKIRRDTPIKTDTTATLMFYGITGLAFVELEGHGKGKILERKNTEIPPTIPTTPSTFNRLDSALSELATKSARALDRLDHLLNDDNLGSINSLLKKAPEMVQSMNTLTQNLDRRLDGLHGFIGKGIAVEDDLSQTLQDVSRAAASTDRLAATLQQTYGALGDEARRSITQVSGMTRNLFDDLEVLITEVQATVEELRTRPADIFFSRSQPRPGPGEEMPQ